MQREETSSSDSAESDHHDSASQETDNEDSMPNNTKNSRKRKRYPNLHKKYIAKQKVERGHKRVTGKGKIIPAKKFIGQTVCKCSPYCSTKIDLARQKEIFTTYYEQSNKTQKTLLIRASIKKIPVAPRKNQFLPLIKQRNRDCNFKYHLKDDEGIEHDVCRSFLLNCYQIPPTTMNRAVQSALSNPTASENRGKASSKNKTTEAARNGVRAFINRFPKYESHYGRAGSQMKYLNSNMNLVIMYRMYKDECERTTLQPVSEWVFRDVFNNDFNLSFKKRHSDTCKTCDYIAVNLKNILLSDEERQKYVKLKEEHDGIAQRIAEEFKSDVKNASDDTLILTFDLQKVLETPSLTTSVAFYKRQLATYNLAIVDEVTQKSYMYVWSENIAARGGQEIASCLFKHFDGHLPNNIGRIILYSDSCGGQNRNIKITLLLKYFLANSNVGTIEEKFFLSGHSYNSCDRSFGLIEKERKNYETINVPDDWIQLIKKTKKKEPLFEVTKMETSDFYSSQHLHKLIVNRKIDVSKEKISWLKIRSIKLEREQLFRLFMRYDDGIMREVDISKKNVTEDQFRMVELSHSYPAGRTITKTKYDDLMELVRYIPPQYKAFYQQLRTDNSGKDFDYASGDSDDE